MPIAPARHSRVVLAVVACALALTCGCRPKPKGPPKGYFGPTLPMREVIAEINRNNERLPTLWMRHSFGAAIVETTRAGKKRTTKIDGNGVIMYQAPNNLLMNGTKEFVGKLFELGCNPNEYWLGVPHESVDTIWHGRIEHLGKPCVAPMPMRPDLVMEVLGVSTFDPNLARFPAPVMKFNNDQDVYMFTWVQRQPDRLAAVKEVWYDRATLRPRLVNLFGEEGRILLRAYLSEHQQVDLEGVSRDQRPYVPGKYDLLFTDSGSRMSIRIDDAYLKYKGGPEPRAFRRPNLDNYTNQHQLDEACRD